MLQDKMITSFFELLLLANASLQAADQSIPIEIRQQLHHEVGGTNKSRTVPSPKGPLIREGGGGGRRGTGRRKKGGEMGPKPHIVYRKTVVADNNEN
jgi:hypothetical protein